MDEYLAGTETAIMHADLALDLKIIASVILFGGYFTDRSPHRDCLIQVLTEWAMEHPFALSPYAEPITSSALIFMIASRFNEQSTLELPLRFFESIDIMAVTHLSSDLHLRCHRIDRAIANEQWESRYGPPLSWMSIHMMLSDLKESEDVYPPHPQADAFRKTMQLVALQIIILLAFKDFRIRKVLKQFDAEMEHEKKTIKSKENRGLSNLVEAAARTGATVETLNNFHDKLLYLLRSGPF